MKKKEKSSQNVLYFDRTSIFFTIFTILILGNFLFAQDSSFEQRQNDYLNVSGSQYDREAAIWAWLENNDSDRADDIYATLSDWTREGENDPGWYAGWHIYRLQWVRVLYQYADIVDPTLCNTVEGLLNDFIRSRWGFHTGTLNNEMFDFVVRYLWSQNQLEVMVQYGDEEHSAYYDAFNYNGNYYSPTVDNTDPHIYNSFDLSRDWLYWMFDRLTTTGDGNEELDSQYTRTFIISLYTLYDFAYDPEMKRKAKIILDFLLLDSILDVSANIHGGHFGRAYGMPVLLGQPRIYNWIYWGIGPDPGGNRGGQFYDAYVSTYRVPELIEDLGMLDDEPDNYWHLHKENNRAGFLPSNHGKWTYATKYYNFGGSTKHWMLNVKSSTSDHCIRFWINNIPEIFNSQGQIIELIEDYWSPMTYGINGFQYKNAMFIKLRDSYLHISDTGTYLGVYEYEDDTGDLFDIDETIGERRFFLEGNVAVCIYMQTAVSAIEVAIIGVDYPTYQAFRDACLNNAGFINNDTAYETSKGDVIEGLWDNDLQAEQTYVNYQPLYQFPFKRMETTFFDTDTTGREITWNDYNPRKMTIKWKDGNEYYYNFTNWTSSFDDDLPPSLPKVWITASDDNASENSSDTGTFKITRDSTECNLIVYFTVSGTADSTDYTLDQESPINFNMEVSYIDITVTANDDTLLENNESVIITIDSTDANYQIGPSNSAAITITDNDVAPLDNYLIGHWRFNEGTGDSTYDETDNHYDGILISSTTWITEGQFEGSAAITFGGNSHVMTSIDILDPGILPEAGNFTIAFWSNPTGEDSWGTYETFSGYDGINQATKIAIRPFDTFGSSGAGAGVSIGTNAVKIVERGSGYLPNPLVHYTAINGWTHIAIVYENNQSKLYINGVHKHTGLQSQRDIYPSGFMIGGTGWDDAYEGSLDDVRIYSRTLTASEIQQVMEDDIDPLTTVTISAIDAEASEESAVQDTGSFEITRDNSDGELTVYFTLDGSALEDDDYIISHSDSITFNDTEQSVTITVTAIDDSLADNNETVELTLSENPDYDYQVGSPSSATITITDNDVAPLDNYLIGHWRFNEGTGTTTVDETDNHNDGTVTPGATWVTGGTQFEGNAAMAFGSNSHINTGLGLLSPDIIPQAGNFTITLWVNPTAQDNWNTYETNYGYNGFAEAIRIAIRPVDGSFYGPGTAGAGVSIGTNGIKTIERVYGYIPNPLVYYTTISGWTHIAIVYENNQASLYINGVYKHTGLPSQKDIYPSGVFIGGTGTDDNYEGSLDDVRIYNRTLTASEILAIYNQLDKKYHSESIEMVQIPEEFAVLQNYPNPFNPETIIQYALPEDGRIIMTIYDIMGREVISLLNEEKPAGYHTVIWDGKDRFGQMTASGLYIYQIQFRDQVLINKMLLMR